MGTKSDYRCYVCQTVVSTLLVIKELNYFINLFKSEEVCHEKKSCIKEDAFESV